MSATALQHADEAARRAAQTVFDRPLVLEAGAGTGKTSALVARLAAWALGPGWEKAAAALHDPDRRSSDEMIAARVLDRIVAITFTEAAAAEMAGRVGEAFIRIEAGHVPEGLLDAALPAVGERQRRAHALVATLDHLAVRTIHAYCRRLLAASPLEAGMHPAFEVDADQLQQANVLHEVLYNALPRAYGDPGDADLLQLAADGFGPSALEAALATLLAAGMSPQDLDDDPFDGAHLATHGAALRGLLQDFVAADGGQTLSLESGRSKLGAAVGAAVAASVQALPAGGPSRGALPAFIGQLQALWPDKTIERLGKWAKGGFDVTERQKLADACEAIATAARALHPKLLHWCGLDPDRVDRARRALRPLLAEARRQLRNRGIATFASLLRGARDLLAGHPQIAARVRQGIDQLLVDEFQDTDSIQCEVIRILALCGPAAERPALFVVGDPKQSIYGWRSADLRAYDRFVDDIRRGAGELHRLSINFRSVPVILGEVERAIEPVMQRIEGVQPAFQTLQASPQRATQAGYVRPGFAPIEYWVSWTDDGEKTSSGAATELEAVALARNLVALHEPGTVRWSDVAILLRSSGDLDTYTQALREADVPYVVACDRSYYLRREVIDASAVVQCILDPADHLALLTFLRAPIVGVPDAALLPLWGRDFPARLTELHGPDEAALDALAQLIRAAAAATPKVPGSERIRGWEHSLRLAVRHVAILRASFRDDPADLFLEKLRVLLLLEPTEAARHLGAYRLANLERFFTQLLLALETSTGDAHAVLRSLRTSVAEQYEAEEARPQESLDDAVQIMTIHAAKGLAFPHVYVMQLHKQSRNSMPPAHEAIEVPGGWEYRLFGAPTLGFADVQGQRAEREAAERVRTLYVAMTRAKDRLVLAANWPRGGSTATAGAHVDLLHERRIDAGQLAGLFEAARDDGNGQCDAAQARWFFPVLARSADPRGSRSSGSAAALLGEVEAESQLLQQRRREAGERMERRFSGSVSEEVHHQRRELLSQGLEDGARGRRGVEAAHTALVARATGTTVHRVLEAFDLNAEPVVELAAQLQSLERHVPGPLSAPQHREVLQRATATLRRFHAGDLWARFVALRPYVLGREVPILLPPGTVDGPVGFVSGAIDMVYRDPQDGSLVVVDFKTDSVDEPDAVEQRAKEYAAQGVLYVRALREAFDLAAAPRFELWFLQAGVVR